MNRLRLLAVPFVLLIALISNQEPAGAALYQVKMTVSVPFSTSWDIAWVDPGSQTFVYADRTNGGLVIVDARNNQFLKLIPGFVGVAAAGGSGPNGVVIIPRAGGRGQAWVGDGSSKVRVVDIDSGLIAATISTGGTNRADELAYDPVHQLLVIANDREPVPFLTFISTVPPYPIVGQLLYDGAHGNAGIATNGLEQPQFDPQTSHFFQNVPATAANPGGEVDEIDPASRTVVTVIPLPAPCGPTGLTLGPNHQAMAACGSGEVVLDLTARKVLTKLTNVSGGDEIWYNSGDNHYYITSGGFLHIVDGSTLALIQDLPTPAGARNVAADPVNNEIFVPTSAGIAVIGLPQPASAVTAALGQQPSGNPAAGILVEEAIAAAVRQQSLQAAAPSNAAGPAAGVRPSQVISPPNTGDGGLRRDDGGWRHASATSAAAIVILSVAFFAIVGLAARKQDSSKN